MRAFIQDGKLHVVTREYQKLASGGEIPEEEMVFDETWTAVVRQAFYFDRAMIEAKHAVIHIPDSEALLEAQRVWEENNEKEDK